MERSPHLDPAWLRRKYIDEGLSTYEIGRLVGRDPKNVYGKLRDFGIPTRPRGERMKTINWKTMGLPNPFLGRSHSPETRALLSAKASVPKPWLRGKRNGMSGRTGASNPNYQDGSSPERQRLYASGEWKAVVRTVYARDGYRCIRCGAAHTPVTPLHAHHVCTWGDCPELRFDPGNLVTLCRTCHRWVHSKANTGRALLA